MDMPPLRRIFRITTAVATLLAIMLLPAPNGAVQAASADLPVQVLLEGKALTFDVPPIIVSGRTLVPLRAIFEALGATVTWDGATQSVTAVKGDRTVRLTVGSATAQVAGAAVGLDVPAQIVSGRTLVPLRFVSAALGAGVDWNDATRTVSISPSFTPVRRWTLAGILPPNMVDATVIQDRSGGGLRMFHAAFQDYSGPEPRGPYFTTATSADGITWQPQGPMTGISGGWPRLIGLPDGTLRMYYGAGGNIAAARSADGRQWIPETVTGFPAPEGPANGYSGLDVMTLPGDGYRMYYSKQEPSARYTMTGVTRIYSATSADGLKWQAEPGARIDPETGAEGPSAAHPRVVRQADGTLRMYYWTAGVEIWSATSRDGIAWTDRQPENAFGADPEVVTLADGTQLLYANYLDSDVSLGARRQTMLVYRRQPVDFNVIAPTGKHGLLNQPVSMDIQVEGKAGVRVTLSAAQYRNGSFTPPTGDAGAVVTPAAGTVPFTATVSLPPLRAGATVLLLTADDGTARTQSIIGVQPQPEP